MPIYRTFESRFGLLHLQEWRRRALRTFALLALALVGCMAGLLLLDSSPDSFDERAFNALWNAANLLSTLGDFTGFNDRQKVFMIATMFVVLIIGGYAVSRLTGLLSSEAVMAFRENRSMRCTLDDLTRHVVVIGFGPLGQLVAGRLRTAGDPVLVVERAEDLAARASELGYLVIHGDAGADDQVLERSGIDRARAMVVTTEDPDRKLAITLMAHARNPGLKIAVTGANSHRGSLLHRAGASDVVIADDLVAGALVARLDAKVGADR